MGFLYLLIFYFFFQIGSKHKTKQAFKISHIIKVFLLDIYKAKNLNCFLNWNSVSEILFLVYKYLWLVLFPTSFENEKSYIPWNLHCQHVCFPAKSVIDGKQWIACSLFLLFRFYTGLMIPRKAQLVKSESMRMWQPEISQD